MADIIAYQGSQEFHGFAAEQEEMLKKPLQERDIKQRKGAGGKMLKYVSGDYAIETANRIFGHGRWGYRVLSRMMEKSISLTGEVTGYFYTADIELYVLGCPFPFPGEGIGIVTPPKETGYITPDHHEKARKEATTDALKRALRHYGDQFGLSLYNEDNYIEAEDGSEKQVKDVGKKGASQQTKRVVDATPQISYYQIYERGKAKKLWVDGSGFCAFASAELGITVTKENVKQLGAELLLQLDKAVEQEQAA